MKKLVVILVLAVLLLGMFGGCGLFGDRVLADYEALREALSSLTEYRFEGTATLSLEAAFLGDAAFSFADLMPLHLSMEGTVSTYHQEIQAIYQYLSADGTPLFDMEMILAGGSMYIDLVAMMENRLRPALEELDIDLTGFSMVDLLEGNTYLAVPADATLDELLFASAEEDSGFDAEPFLTRQGDAFVVTVEGEYVREMMDEMNRILSQFLVDQGGDGIGDVLGDMSLRLAGADLTDASVVRITSRIGGVFYQSIRMQVPGFLDMQVDFSYIAEVVLPVWVPMNALTEAAFERLIQNIDFDAALSPAPHVEDQTPEEITLRYDLVLLNLVGHHIHDDSILETAALGDGRGGEHSVAVIAGHERTEGERTIFSGTDAIEMYYVSQTYLDAVEAVLQAVQADREEYFLPDSTLRFSALRTNGDRSIAAMAIAEQTATGLDRVHIYLGQVIPETGDTIRLELSLYTNWFTNVDDLILAELSVHIGVDLGAYVTELVGT